MVKEKRDILDLTRHFVGTINLEDLYETDNEDDNAKLLDYMKEAELVFVNRSFQNELKRITKKQLEFIACEAETLEKVAVGRGVLLGVSLLMERFQYLSNEYRKKAKGPDKKFNKFDVL